MSNNLPAVTSRRSGRRTAAVDGLKGIAIILVVLFHWHIVWPRTHTSQVLGSFDALFLGGNVAVTVFFATSGYLVTGRLLKATEERRAIGPLLYMEKRVLRILAQVLVLLVAVYLVWRIDPTDTASERGTVRSLLAVATFSYNRFVASDPLSARSDLGPLYFLSIDVQYFVVAAIVIILLAHRRRLLTGVVVVALAAVLWWRWQFFVEEGWFQAALSTPARADGLLAGSLMALLSDTRLFASLRRRAADWAGAAALVLLGTLVACTYLEIDAYFGLHGAIAAVASAVLVAMLYKSGGTGDLTSAALSFTPLVVVGRASLTIFLWHMPILHAVRRHAGEASAVSQSVLALTVLVAVSVVVERTVVPRIGRVLDWLFSRRLLRTATQDRRQPATTDN